MKKFNFLMYFLLVLIVKTTAQVPYTQELFEVRIDTNINYGVATNYAGNQVSLLLDIYKPIADNNTKRPILVLVHGGAWIGGSKNEVEIQNLAQLFAKRGYVVAAINYRLGMHPSASGGSNTATCSLVTPQANCVYVADSAEVVRAIYRGMQDVKGAIRFMKGRADTDSTCSENTYLSGVSAGGFCSLAAAFMDVTTEKPLPTFAIENAEQPATSLNYCHAYFNETNATISRLRPDLGNLEGTIALNNTTSNVKGVANFYGGMLTNLFNQFEGESPLLYLFHQTADVVVNCGRAPILSSLSYNCLAPFGFLGCNHIWNMPWSSGSCSINGLLTSSIETVQVQDAIVNNGSPNCLIEPAGHSILNAPQRVNEITNFFGVRIAATELSGCENSVGIEEIQKTAKLFPNPANEQLYVTVEFIPHKMEITDIHGRVVLTKITDEKMVIFETAFLAKGLYFLNCYISSSEKIVTKWLHN